MDHNLLEYLYFLFLLHVLGIIQVVSGIIMIWALIFSDISKVFFQFIIKNGSKSSMSELKSAILKKVWRRQLDETLYYHLIFLRNFLHWFWNFSNILVWERIERHSRAKSLFLSFIHCGIYYHLWFGSARRT